MYYKAKTLYKCNMKYPYVGIACTNKHYVYC